MKNDNKTTWRKELESIDVDACEVIAVTPSDLDWDKRFYPGFGGSEGTPFVAWTKNEVIFCVVYDGSEWLTKLPRNPDGSIVPQHFGGQ